MKKNNIILAIILIAFVACVALVIFFRLDQDRKRDVEVTNIDLTVLRTTIDSETEFGGMSMQSVDKPILLADFQIEEDKVEEVIGKIPFINVYSNMYLIIKATDGNVEMVKEKLETYGKDYEKQWERYLPEQYELVKRRKIGNKGNYVYLVVSDSADEIEEMIK